MRLLFTIPHFYRPTAKGLYGSLGADRSARVSALGRCITAIHRLFSGTQYTTSLVEPVTGPANESTLAKVDVSVCTTGEDHVLEDLSLSSDAYERHVPDCDPQMLGFECHALLRDQLGNYDFYCYLEDDMILHDPWFFLKLRSFTAQAGDRCVLQPNRYELARNVLAKKAYIDGDLAEDKTSRYQDVTDHPQVVLMVMGVPVLCRRTRNPHSGCFFLNARQMEAWTRQPYFLDRDGSFYSPLESAASLGVMRTFRVYKTVGRFANFLEIQHAGDAWMKRLERHPAEARFNRGTSRSSSAAPAGSGSPDAPCSSSAQPETNKSTRRLLIHSVLMAPGPNEAVRVSQPNERLSSIFGVRTVTHVKTPDFSVADPDEEKIFLWQRPILKYPDSIPRLKALLGRGYLIIVEYDDDFHRRPEHAANRYLTFRGCHCIQTSTAALAESLREFNSNVQVFGNQIADLPGPRAVDDGNPLRILFAAFNRGKDWGPIMPTLNRVVRKLDSRIYFVVMHDRHFFDALETSHKEFQPMCGYEKYVETLQGCDIALLPLEPTRMNFAKSDLKFIENAACGVAVLAGKTVYENSIEDGVTGLIYRSPEEFETKLLELVTNRDLRRRLSAQAYDYVRRERLLSRHYRDRYEWYLRMRDDLPRLNRELILRVPELADAV